MEKEQKFNDSQTQTLQQMQTIKARTWCAVFYPESLPDDWKEQLKAFADKVYIGLHDSDINEDGSGTLKKLHYHIIMDFCNDKRGDVIAAFCFSLNQPKPQKCKSIASAVRYLIHKDHPDKYQYDRSIIEEYGKARGTKCADDYLTSNADETSDLNDILDFCEENKVFSFSLLRKYTAKKKPDWNNLIMRKCAYIVKETLKSDLWDLKMDLKNDFFCGRNDSGMPKEHFKSADEYADFMLAQISYDAKAKVYEMMNE